MPLLAVLVASGAAGLIYQICWIRTASFVVGSTTYALGVVLATFFGGLALGSAIFGRLAATTRNPIRVYAALELGIALLGAASLAAFGLADTALTRISTWSDWPAIVWVAEILILTLILTPPATLMGGTLPLFCRQFIDQRERIVSRVSWLYALNTLGAAAGCVAAGMYLIPTIGIRASIFVAVVLNLFAAAVAWFVPVTAPQTMAPSAVTLPTGKARLKGAHSSTESDKSTVALTATLFFLTGLVALANEVLWTRFAALLVSNTITTYTITIGIVLVGIAAGSIIVSALGRFTRAAFLFGLLQAVLASWVLFVMHLSPEAWRSFGDRIWMYTMLFLPPALISGASFPLAVRVATDDVARVAERVGELGAANMAGGIVGAIGAAFLLPALGLETGVRLTTALSLVAAWIAWMALDRHSRQSVRLLLSVAAGIAWVAVARLSTTDIPRDFLTRNGVVIAVKEGAQSNLAVSRSDGLTLLTSDHWWQGQDEKSHQIMAAHVPMLLHPSPRNVLVIGVGAGQTPARFTMYDIARLDAVDIDPAIFEIVREHFDSKWMDDPRVRLLAEDGRTVIQRSQQQYDVISIEVGQLLRPGVGAFYTRDFYERARDRLADGGIISQFVPLSFLTPSEFRNVVRTFIEVFPQAVLWYNRAEPLLVGINGPRLLIDPGRLELLQKPGPVQDDLRFSLWGGEAQWQNRPEVFVAGYLSGPKGLRALAAGGEIYSDDRPVLEYRTGTVIPLELSQIPIFAEIAAQLDPIGDVLPHPMAGDIASRATQVRAQHLAEIAVRSGLGRGVAEPAR